MEQQTLFSRNFIARSRAALRTTANAFTACLALSIMLCCNVLAADSGIAVTTKPTSLKVSLAGGSAIKKIPINTRLTIVKKEGDTLTVRDEAGLQGTVAKSDVRMESASATAPSSAPQKAQLTPPSRSPQVPDPKLDAAMKDAQRAPHLSPRGAEDVVRQPAPEPAPSLASSSSPIPTAPPSGSAPQAAKPGQPVTAEALDAALGIQLFADENLWDDSAAKVAERLKWPRESVTSVQSSYRLYSKSVHILRSRAYSMVLYAKKDKPDLISIVFANKGDFEGLADMRRPRDKEKEEPLDSRQERELKKTNTALVDNFTEAVKNDAKTIQEALTALLGPPVRQEFGTTEAMREQVLRWNWKNTAILLASPRDEYTALRILSTEAADDKGKTANLPSADLRDWLKSCVVKSDNGDVLIKQIPMVDQGPKGYCVPATWERYLRFMDVPADMYVLAMAGETRLGGGTSTAVIRNNVTALARQYGRRIESIEPAIDIRNIDKYIDKGLPIMWTVYVNEEVEKAFTDRNLERERTTNWGPYIESLKAVKKELRGKKIVDNDRGHMRMIIGYNAKTKEIAISDSWGKWAEVRWLTLDEAQAITAGDLTVMRW